MWPPYNKYNAYIASNGGARYNGLRSYERHHPFRVGGAYVVQNVARNFDEEYDGIYMSHGIYFESRGWV